MEDLVVVRDPRLENDLQYTGGTGRGEEPRTNPGQKLAADFVPRKSDSQGLLPAKR